MEINFLRKKRDALKELTWETTTKALAQFEEVEHLKQSLKRAESTLYNLEEKVSQLKEELVVTSILHFEKEKR